MRVVIVDNYDSFTYNLQQSLAAQGAQVLVIRNDHISVPELSSLDPDRVVLSPGPGTPSEAGICEELVRALAGQVPILGVCLGHQAIATALGGRVTRSPRVMHGKTSLIHHDGQGVYRGVLSPLVATRYHSLVVEEATLPACLQVTARSEDGLLMGLRHRDLPAHLTLEGVQFHPESFLTQDGDQLLGAFLGSHLLEPAF